MATNTIQDSATTVQVIAGGTYVSGTPVRIGSLFGVPQAAAVSGEEVALQIRGEVKLVKVASVLAFAVGDKVYWDGTTCTGVVTDQYIGVATRAATAASTELYVELAGQVIPASKKTVTARLQGLTAAGAATTTRTAIPIWKNNTGKTVTISHAQFRQCGAIEFASDANDTYAISLAKTGGVSIVASVTYDDSPVLPVFTAVQSMVIITAASANVLTAGQELFATWSCSINDVTKIMPDVEILIDYDVA